MYSRLRCTTPSSRPSCLSREIGWPLVHPVVKVRAFDRLVVSQGIYRLCIDSTVLAYVMKALNDRYQYGLELFLLSIDEGITGYRDDSLEVCPVFPSVMT